LVEQGTIVKVVNLGYILKVKSTGLAGILDMGSKKSESRMIQGLNDRSNGDAIY
jgi:hypothetical protein